jgi:tetratricopeptide (TPR) repeat protein
MLAQADLARYAGQFVWLELNYDSPQNRAFLTKFGASATPTFFVIDPQTETVAATQTGAMSLPELREFLRRGAGNVFAGKQSPADAALLRGDALLAQQPVEAVQAYREALRLAPAIWPKRDLAEASIVAALQASRQWRQCAEAAAAEAAYMKRGPMFGRTIVAGMWCVVSPGPASWSKAAAAKLEPLAKEALSLPTTVRDHRDELYRTLMRLSLSRSDTLAAAEWGSRWLDELDAIKPVSDEERSAVDIARVENIQTFGSPSRILPALMASERAMPDNYNASLRVAQMESAAKHYDQAIAACDRGLARSPGAAGRAWLLQIKADALTHGGRTAEAHHALQQALQAAKAIPNQHWREVSMKTIENALGLRGGSVPTR